MALATSLKNKIEASDTENHEAEIYQELLDALPAEAKKGLRRRNAAAKASADFDQGPANRVS